MPSGASASRPGFDAGHGCCLLREPAAACLVQDALLCFDGVRYRLLAWVVMPNHVHVLFQPLEGWTMARIVASWKSFTGRRLASAAAGVAGIKRRAPGLASRVLGPLHPR